MVQFCRLAFLVAAMLILTFCKKEEEKKEEIIPIDAQLLGDTDVELLGSQFWTTSASINGFINGRVEDISRSPTHSLKLSRTVADPLLSANIMQNYQRQMPTGEDLTLTAHVKCVNVTGTGVAIAIVCLDDKFARMQIAATDTISGLKGTFDWTPQSVVLQDMKTNVRYLRVMMLYLPNTSGTAYFDDFSLTHKP